LHYLTNENNFYVILFMLAQQKAVHTDFPSPGHTVKCAFFVFWTCEHIQKTFMVMVIFHVMKSLSIIIMYTPT
jgi:hypothetical protein